MPRRDLRAFKIFDDVRRVGLALPRVEAAIRYDGSPVLKVGGCFMAGIAAHPSVEPGTLVVRYRIDEREWLIADAPETYYLTDYYRRYPLLLARLARLDADALHDLLSVSWSLTVAKCRRSENRHGHGKHGNGANRDTGSTRRN